jgi:hypothetical protein
VNFLEIMSNFWAALVILAAVTIGYLLFVMKHSYSEKAKDAFQAHLKGCIVDAVVWFAIFGIAVVLASRNIEAGQLFVQVIGTKIFNVPLIMWSMVVVPITFSVHKAYGGFDYRGVTIGSFVLIGFVYGIYYTITGYPPF